MKAAVVNKKGRVFIREVADPRPPKGGLVMRVTAVGICGSDLAKLGHAPDGTVLGHEVAGIVEEIGSGTEGFRPGDRITAAHHIPCGRCIYCRRGNESQCELFRSTDLDPGGWAEYLALSPRHIRHVSFLLPHKLSDEEASMTEPLGCCVRAARRAEVSRGDVVVVIGLGPVGLMITALLRRKGVTVLALDKILSRSRLAAQLFGATALPRAAAPLKRAVDGATKNRGADQVILCAGAGSTLPLALSLIRRGGKLHLFSGVDEGKEIPIDINAIYKKEIRLFSTYSSSPEDLGEAFRLIRRGSIPVKELITHRLPLTRIEEGIEAIRRGRALKVILEPTS